MNAVETMLLNEMSNRAFQKAISDDFAFVDCLMEECDEIEDNNEEEDNNADA